MRYLLIFTMLLVTCGTAPDETTDKNILPIEDCPKDDQCPDEEEKTMAFGAISIDSVIDMPACIGANNRQLVFVVSEKTFYYCKNFQWIETDFSKELCTEEPAKTPEPTPDPHRWSDPISGTLWLIGGSGVFGGSPCVGEWTMPNIDQAIMGVENGLRNSLITLGITEIWSKTSGQYEGHEGYNITTKVHRAYPDPNTLGYICFKIP